MNLTKFYFGLFVILFHLCFPGCKTNIHDNIQEIGREPVIEPDYCGVTIPPNIAPLNFILKENYKSYIIRVASDNSSAISVNSSNGIVRFPLKSWRKLLQNSQGNKIEIEVIARDSSGISKKFTPISMDVSMDPMDPYICYRLLYPGYRYWVEMKIVQRCIENFRETSVFENQLLENNCVNCHSFNQNNPDKFLLHVRGTRGGTYFFDGKKLTRTTLKTDNMPANVVYPAWHPSGKYIAFSSNRTVQQFHMRPEKNIEVSDQYSSLVIYDVERNEIYACHEKDTAKYMETFPCWSPDGLYLYYCRTPQVKRDHDYMQVKYDLFRKSFHPELGSFGETELIYDAKKSGKSVSFPAVSPDKKFLIFTLHDYGTFSIWHRDADLYLLNLKTQIVEKMNLNSDETESYHSWSSNSKWLVFSSKRDDGLTARLYFSHIDSTGNAGKSFILPQNDPGLYKRMGKTFNRPEFITGRIKKGPRDFGKVSGKDPIKARWIEKDQGK